MQIREKKKSLVWFRNDLRIHDNESLTKATTESDNVTAIFCFDPKQFSLNKYGFKKTEKFRAKFLIETIHALKSQLKTLNIELLIYYEHPEIIIPQVCEKYEISCIYLQKEWTSEEESVKFKTLGQLPMHIEITETYNQFLFHPKDLNIACDNVPDIFSSFRKKVEKGVIIREEYEPLAMKISNLFENKTKVPNLKDLGFTDFKIPTASAFPFYGGENEALNRLKNYFFKYKRIGTYKKTRNGLVGTEYSSKFSPWLANGSISAKTIYWQVKKFETIAFKNNSTYWLIFELIWRDYFKYISIKHGVNIFKLNGILNKTYQWSVDTTDIASWINGTTTSNFVNANMIELKETGWMSNRGRQNAASFFAKELKLDWRIGAAYFESLLLDYDVHSNYGNWLYVSGVGNDPRDRKFNVNLQAERYDPSGTFQRLWLQPSLF